MNVYIIKSGEDMGKTMVIAKDENEAIRKFFIAFANLRDAVLDNDISNKIEITYDGKTVKRPTLAYLVILKAISREEAIEYLNKDVKSIKKCEKILDEGIQKCQWIREIR